MFIDSNGFECWIDIQGRKHTKVQGDKDCFYSYENIIKNMEKQSGYFKTFNIKRFISEDICNIYQECDDKMVLEFEPFRKIAKVRNPELLI